MWRAIDGDRLDPIEQSALIRLMATVLNEPSPPPTYPARLITKLMREYSDE